jgi:hypothetical protein
VRLAEGGATGGWSSFPDAARKCCQR